MNRFSGSSVVTRHCSAKPLVSIASCSGHPHRFLVERMAVGQQDLAADHVDAGDHLGDGVLDLDARIDLDEVEAPAVDVDQELHRAGRAIAHRSAQTDRGVADPLSDLLGEVRARRNLDHLLVTALHRAVALPEMDEVAVRVAENLHFDVLGPRDVALEEDVGLTERRRGFAPRLGDLLGQVPGPLDRPDPAAAAAKAGLDHQRVSDPLSDGRDVIVLAEGRLGAGHRRHADRMREPPRGDFVAERLEMPRRRTDEADSRFFAGAREAGVLGEESVARVNRIGAAALRDRDDLVDVEIRADRLAALGGADRVRLVGLEAM